MNHKSNRGEMPPMPGRVEAEADSKPSLSNIKVVAMRKGFYKQHRKAEGDEFVVSKFDELGSWMKCLDPSLEKKRLDLMAELKEKARAGASK